MVVSFSGFVYLILSGVSAPSLRGFFLWALWGSLGLYSLRGHDSKALLWIAPIIFFRSLPLIVLLMIFTVSNASVSLEGVLLAVVPGGVTSGIGYAIWYVALTGLSSSQTAVLKLSVPVIATFGGVILVSEAMTPRLVVSGLVVLGGILMVILGKHYFPQCSSAVKT